MMQKLTYHKLFFTYKQRQLKQKCVW